MVELWVVHQPVYLPAQIRFAMVFSRKCLQDPDHRGHDERSESKEVLTNVFLDVSRWDIAGLQAFGRRHEQGGIERHEVPRLGGAM